MIPRVFQVVTASGLNLRSGSGTEYPSRAVLRRGAAVEVMAFDGKWLAVRSEEGPGWVAARYTSPHPTPWYAVARQEAARGVREVPGAGDDPRVLEYHAATLLKATEDSVPWCSAFVCWCCEQVGVRSTKSAAAQSWLGWGRPVTDPVEGVIAIFRRGGNPKYGHVALFVRLAPAGGLVVLGGNQGNRVCEETIPAAHLLGYRLPSL